ncbi:hypothetical protein QBE52_11210 [Clostridiaceae bacterium 35-E11]
MERRKVILLTMFILLCAGFIFYTNRPMTKNNAVKRVEGFIKAVNDNKPESIYNYLTPDIKEIISKEDFIESFAKERSYPYLTPLYLYLDHLTLQKDKREGIAECTVASRLPGEKMKFEIFFVKGNYYVNAFKEVADGSFIKKFEKLSP